MICEQLIYISIFIFIFVQKIIGGQRKGNKDGNLTDALFYNPQGIAIESKFVFYVADTGNHSIRKVRFFIDLICNGFFSNCSRKINW